MKKVLLYGFAFVGALVVGFYAVCFALGALIMHVCSSNGGC